MPKAEISPFLLIINILSQLVNTGKRGNYHSLLICNENIFLKLFNVILNLFVRCVSAFCSAAESGKVALDESSSDSDIF